ncbi:fimbrillin MatB-like protein [Serratia fonticola]|uniref:Common pilus major fimbrillin subunit EcpA n=1 Tax=Serratia fonticola TaxID=47917 RepID=A0A559T2S5_SERFO|nr:common pilus major fimbrillin subunit EcpA [Serratia fonticola]TQI78603.1 fimbrillin MatB-like protein [Serratia fonticola]TQI99375.1 fimbrillin MatB-like protein [Serratia fonticola]TVZ68899.1 fimbrillin MatB-like protein [Serratia fonticola]
MKKLALALIAASAMGTINLANAETRTANATASWDAKAIKDTNSMLVVTPLKSLTFNYAEGLERFSTQDGAFDITIAGQSGASDFKLTSKIISNTLVRTSDDSELTVGVKWNGTDLSNSTETTMIDTTSGVSAGLSALAQESAYAGSDRTSTQGVFAFNIAKATVGGADTAFKDLTDGYWDGNVNVEFAATWDGTFTPAP